MAIALAISILAFTACSDAEGPSHNDKKIIEKLNLKESENGFAIDGDVFCEVSDKLLNDAAEIEDLSNGERGLAVTSRAGNVGVEGVPPFANDCREVARKKLSKLDPEPAEE